MKAKALRLARNQGNGAGQAAGAATARFSFTEPQTDVLLLDGQIDGHPAHLKLRKMALLGQRFHWIFEPPPEDR